MGFKNLRLFEITGTADTGYPTYSTTAIRLQGNGDTQKEDFNSVSIKITNNTKSRTLAADDKEKTYSRTTNYSIELEVYRVEKEAAGAVFGYLKDKNGDVEEILNSSDKKRFGLFFEGSTSDGLIYQKYLYDVEFVDADFDASTDSGDGTATLKLTGNGNLITKTADQKMSRGYTVYKGSPEFITGPATKMFVGPTQ